MHLSNSHPFSSSHPPLPFLSFPFSPSLFHSPAAFAFEAWSTLTLASDSRTPSWCNSCCNPDTLCWLLGGQDRTTRWEEEASGGKRRCTGWISKKQTEKLSTRCGIAYQSSSTSARWCRRASTSSFFCFVSSSKIASRLDSTEAVKAEGKRGGRQWKVECDKDIQKQKYRYTDRQTEATDVIPSCCWHHMFSLCSSFSCVALSCDIWYWWLQKNVGCCPEKQGQLLMWHMCGCAVCVRILYVVQCLHKGIQCEVKCWSMGGEYAYSCSSLRRWALNSFRICVSECRLYTARSLFNLCISSLYFSSFLNRRSSWSWILLEKEKAEEGERWDVQTSEAKRDWR